MLYKILINWIKIYYNKLQNLLNKLEENLYCVNKYYNNKDVWIVYKKHNPNIQYKLYIPSLYFTIVEPTIKGAYFVAKTRSEIFFYKILEQYDYSFNMLNEYLQFLNIFDKQI